MARGTEAGKEEGKKRGKKVRWRGRWGEGGNSSEQKGIFNHIVTFI